MKVYKIAKTILYIVGISLIINNLISLLGGILGFFLSLGKTTDELIKILGIKPIFPDLLYVGGISGLITSVIYIVSAVYLLRLRSWARKFLLWFIPVMTIFDISYLYLVDMLNKNTAPSFITDFVIWIILLNKNIKDLFEEDI